MTEVNVTVFFSTLLDCAIVLGGSSDGEDK